MKEFVFIEKNNARWKDFEKMLSSETRVTPDIISDSYIQVTDDLAYARTYYPRSKVTAYLNSLAIKIHHTIYRNKKVKSNQFSEFWLIDYPLLVYKNRRFIIYALILFFISVAIGLLSAANDNTFTRLILGNQYVNMTMEFIKKGDPMAVYKKMNPSVMFVGITLNNIYVAFRCVIFGVFLSIGTALALLQNGIMVGAFQQFFAQQHLLKESVLTIYIHGTFELFAIIISSSAGFIIGSGILFPNTQTRVNSFITGVREAMRLLIGVIPLFIIAGFLEGFVTRLTYLPDLVRASMILISCVIILYYFFIYPTILSKKLNTHGN